MHCSKKKDQSTITLSSEELAACRKKLEHRWKNRTVDTMLLERAWQTAYQIAAVLYDEFQAKHVAVFGSLTEPIGFKESSDIDIAVWGLTDKEHTKAKDRIWDIEIGFKIDLINFDLTKNLFQQRIQQQAIPIINGEQHRNLKTIYQHHNRNVFPIVEEEIYEIKQERLTQRINDECVKIESTVNSIVKALEDINVLPAAAKQYIEETIANRLSDVYRGIERIFERIADEVDGYLPKGDRWHKDLLEQMTRQRPERQPVISQETFLLLKDLLEFRHKINNIYADEIIYDNTETHAKNIERLYQSFSNDLKMFIDSLAHNKDDV